MIMSKIRIRIKIVNGKSHESPTLRSGVEASWSPGTRIGQTKKRLRVNKLAGVPIESLNFGTRLLLLQF